MNKKFLSLALASVSMIALSACSQEKTVVVEPTDVSSDVATSDAADAAVVKLEKEDPKVAAGADEKQR